MELEVKEEPLNISTNIEEDSEQTYNSSIGSNRRRKRQFAQDPDSIFRPPEVTTKSIEEMHCILREWGLEALQYRFDEHLIDINVLDYILDVDIVDLCRDLPIRYRLLLRHNIKNKHYKRNVATPKRSKQMKATLTKCDDEMSSFDLLEDSTGQNSFEDIPSSHFVSVDSHPLDATENNESIRAILSQDPKFRHTLALLDQQLIPDSTGLCHMNRLLTNHFFEKRIIVEKRYPKRHEKHELALKILQAFPHLEKTRPHPEAPEEAYFFWENSGKEKGPHSGLIETRTANMRKEVPPEERFYQRRKETVLSEDIHERAMTIASLDPVPQNKEIISTGMAECTGLHSSILQQGNSNKTDSLLTTFPHLLSYGGDMILQVFQRLHTNYKTSTDLNSFLRSGLLLDENSFGSIKNKYMKSALRMMKQLNGKKEEAVDKLSDEAEAAPLIRWLKRKNDEKDEAIVQRHISECSYLAPHIVCIADVFKDGPMFVVFQGKYIPCGKSATHALDVFFKMFAVLAVPVPLLLRKLHELLMVHLWKTSNTCKSVIVAKLISKLNTISGYVSKYDST